jgi:hypothetical protein
MFKRATFRFSATLVRATNAVTLVSLHSCLNSLVHIPFFTDCPSILVPFSSPTSAQSVSHLHFIRIFFDNCTIFAIARSATRDFF